MSNPEDELRKIRTWRRERNVVLWMLAVFALIMVFAALDGRGAQSPGVAADPLTPSHADAPRPSNAASYAQCRELLLLPAPEGRGSWQDKVACWRSHQVIPSWPWASLARCEAGDQRLMPRHPKRVDASRVSQWSIDSHFDGGLQFLPETWGMALERFGLSSLYPTFAYQASPRMQVIVARKWLGVTSWEQWPVCSRRIGAR